jgi:hypothetical protein
MGIPDQIILTGKVYIKYIDDLSRAVIGDVKLYLNDDAINPFPGDYDNLTDDGYIKAKIFDGRVWQMLDIGEFCMHRENKFAKKQRAIDSAYLCKDIMTQYKAYVVRRTYRGHFTRIED